MRVAGLPRLYAGVRVTTVRRRLLDWLIRPEDFLRLRCDADGHAWQQWYQRVDVGSEFWFRRCECGYRREATNQATRIPWELRYPVSA